MKKLNSMGLSLLPSVNPVRRGKEECVGISGCRTRQLGFVYNACRVLCMRPLTPFWCNTLNRAGRHTLGKAVFRSIKHA